MNRFKPNATVNRFGLAIAAGFLLALAFPNWGIAGAAWVAPGLLLLAGATILPANPGFYTHPKTVEEVVDTVVARVLDHLGIAQKLAPRWQEEE